MDTLIETANFIGDRWGTWVIGVTLDSTVLLALTGLIWMAIRKQVSPQVGYCLFLLVPLKVLVPVSVSVPPAVAQWIPSASATAWFDMATADRDRAPGTGPVQAVRIVNSVPNFESNSIRRQSTTNDTLQRDLPAATSFPLNTPSPAEPVASTQARTPRLSTTASVAILWLSGVLLLLGRFVRTQLRFRTRLKRSSPLTASQLPVDLQELCRLAGVTQPVRIVEDDGIAAPAVWGLVHSTIILPRQIATALTAPQLKWVLLHELAHVGRRDLLLAVLQRVAAILHFFNPAIWIANRIVDQLREYACDDRAVVQSNGSTVEPGEAFMQILRHANQRPRGIVGALGVFGLDSRAACFLRVRRLLDSDRPTHTQFSRWAVGGLILLAVVALPQLRAGGDGVPASPTPAAPQTATVNQPQPLTVSRVSQPKNEGQFELKVVGPNGEPIPDAAIEIRARPGLTAEQILQGKFVKKLAYGVHVTANAEGRLLVKYPQSPSNFEAHITIPEYGPYMARWSSETQAQSMPPSFTAELEAGWSVGGVVVDQTGQPLTGVKVHPNINFKVGGSDLGQIGIGDTMTTDTQGRWHFNSAPISKSQVFVEIDHPGFMPERRPLTRSEFGIEQGRGPTGKIVLQRGLAVTGKVTDEAGQPVAGALIRTKFVNLIREARTDENGIYRLEGCEPVAAKIVVSAKGRATDMQQLRIEPDMKPVNFQMQPGGQVRVRVLDNQGQPVPKARIFFQRWRGSMDYFEFRHVNEYADDKGVWVWNEAPLDEFRADICPPDGMCLAEQPLVARKEEYIFRTPPALVVSGKVFDAVTKQPIEKFQVIQGIRSSETHMNWVRDEIATVTNGQYRIRQTHDYFAYLVRIEADGYLPIVSRDIKSNEGNVSLDFDLKKGTDIAATVTSPDGTPAAKALIILGTTGSQINIVNGEIDDFHLCTKQDANDDGQFRFPPQSEAFQLVILHPSGYAHATAVSEPMPATIRLEAWARVEGTFRTGKDATPNIPITINSETVHSYGENAPSIFTHHDLTTGVDGKFVFNRVFAGPARIGRRIMLTAENGAAGPASAGLIPVQLLAGKLTRIDLGGTGRPVIGKLQPPPGVADKVEWNFTLVEATPYLNEPPKLPQIPADIAQDPVKSRDWLHQWEQTDAGKAWVSACEANHKFGKANADFIATVNREGIFRIDDMPAGKYQLTARFQHSGAGLLGDYRFAIPAMNGGRSDTPLDLGVLALEKP